MGEFEGDIVQKIRVEADTSQATLADQALAEQRERTLRHYQDMLDQSNGKEKEHEEAREETQKKQLGFWDTLEGKITKYVAGIGAATAAFQFLKSSIAEAMEAEQVQSKLAAALDATGQGGEAAVAQMVRLAEELQDLTGIEDDQIVAVEKLALNYGVTTDGMEKAMRAAAALSSVTDMDLRTSFETLARIQETGVVPRTLKAMEAFRDLSAEELRNLDIMDRVNEKLGSQIGAGMDTASGAVTRLTNAWRDLQKEVGKSLDGSGAINWLAQQIKGYAEAPSKAAAFAAGMQPADAAPEGESFTFEEYTLPGLSFKQSDINKTADKQQSSADKTRLDASKKYMEEVEARQKFDAEMAKAEEKALDDRAKAYANRLNQDAKDVLDSKANTEKLLTAQARSAADERLKIKDAEADEAQRIAEEAARQQIKTEQEKNAQIEKIMGYAQTVTTSFLSAGLSALEKMAEGEEVIWSKVLKDVLKGLGGQLIGQGVSDLFKGASRALGSYGLDPTSEGLLAIGAAEVVIGGGMFAGSLAVGGADASSVASGGGNVMRGGGASSGTTAFSGGSIGTSSGPSSGGDKNITININGPSLSSPQMGVAIRDALAAAAKVGV